MTRLIWSPSARAALEEINSPGIRRRIRELARIYKNYPSLHLPRQTRSWGLVKRFIVSPFAVMYRHAHGGRTCEVLAIIHEDLYASVELEDQ